MLKITLLGLATALIVGTGLSLASGVSLYGQTTSFGSQRSQVASSFKTTPSGVITNLEGNQTSSTGVDNLASVLTSVPNVSAAVDTWGTAGVSGTVSTKIQTSGTGFAPVNLYGLGEQTSASSGRATAAVSSVAMPACHQTCW